MKKRMTKFLALGLAVVMGTALMACGGSNQEQKPVENTPSENVEDNGSADEVNADDNGSNEANADETGERVPIMYAFWGAEEEANGVDSVSANFNKSQDHIQVTEMAIPWETYMEKLNTMATGGNLPDTAIMSEAGVLQWAQEGLLYDISSMYDESEAKPLESCAFTYDGKTVAYSTANNSLILFYNKDMFDAAGLEYPSTKPEEAWTWDEFVDVAKKLTLDVNGKNATESDFDSNNIVQYGCMVENLTWQLEIWCRSNGSGFYNEDGSEVIINEDAAIEALQAVADLYLVHHVAPLSAGLTDDGVQRSLVAGTCAMTTNGVWNIGTCLSEAREAGLNYGIGVLPYMKEKLTLSTGGPNVVFSQTKHPEEAMEWLKYYSREENSWDSLIATGIWMPLLDSYYTDEAMTKKWLENPAYPEYEMSKDVLCDYVRDYAKPTAWYYTNNTVDFNNLLGSILGDVWSGKITAKEAIESNYDALVAAHDGF